MKLTKREYTKQMNELVSLKASVQIEIDFRIAAIGDRQISINEADSINDMHDKVSELEQSIKDLDSRWNTRNWTYADWTCYELASQNID